MFRFIGETLRSMLAEWRQLFEEYFTWEDPKDKLQNELRILYGRGEIPSERFLELRARLDRDQIGLGDIQMVHLEAMRRLRAGGQSESHSPDREIERSLNRLYLDRGLVEEARAGLARSQEALSNEARWVQQQVEAARKNARAALPDENQARSHLQTWHRLASAAGDIETRRAALQQEMQRIEEMEAELHTAITRLKLLDYQERLAELALGIRQDLFAQAQKR